MSTSLLRHFLLSLSTVIIIGKTVSQPLQTNIDPSKGYINVNTPRSPESAGFEKYGVPNVSEFTGTTNIAIPIYTLKGRNLSVPIALSYQATGIRVSQEASWVGLGWDLTAGGRITVETRGSIDFSGATRGLASRSNLANGMQKIFDRLGTSRENAVFTAASICENTCTTPPDPNMDNLQAISDMDQYGVGEPDIFRASFMGHSFRFYIDMVTGAPTFLGEQDNSRIAYTLDSYNNITAWTVTGDDGVVYYFNLTETVTNTIPGNALIPSAVTSAWLLTKAVHPNGDYIQYSYNNFGFSVPAFTMSASITWPVNIATASVSSDQFQNISIQSPYYLTKIETADVVVDFILGSRTDLYGPGSRLLSQIKVTDKLSNTVKRTATFNYSYFQSALRPWAGYLASLQYDLPAPLTAADYIGSSPSRLRLDALNIVDNSYQPPYRFTYNSSAVPDKYDYGQDHWGFYNGANNSVNGYAFSHLIPQTSFGSSTVANPQFAPAFGGLSHIGVSREYADGPAQAMMLTSITYPTGGSTAFSYEPHQSVMNGATPVTGGGLRVKAIKQYAADGKLSGTTNYSYSGGKYMGTIGYYTDDNQLGSSEGAITGHEKLSSNGAVNFNEILVGYGQVTTSQTDPAGVSNGSVIKNFEISTASAAYSLGFDVVSPYSPPGEAVPIGNQIATFYQWADPPNKALPPTPSDNLEGKLMREEYRDNTGNLIKSTDYNYQLANYANKLFDVRAIQNRECGFNCGSTPYEGWGTGGNRPVLLFVSPAKSYRTLTSSVTENTYQGSSYVSSKKTYTYNALYQLATETSYNSDGKQTVTGYQYTADVRAGSNLANEMYGRNILSTVFSTSIARGGAPVMTTTSNYYEPYTGVYVPQSTSVQIGSNAPETREVYNAYDTYGHLMERQQPNGTKEDFLWGYDHQVPVAKITGSDIGTATGKVDQGKLDSPQDDATLRTELAKLRSIPNALVSSYTYDPTVGLTSETDPKGYTGYYVYDGAGRLQHMLDKDGNVVKTTAYGYTGQPSGITAPSFTNDQQQATFTSTACGAGTIPQSAAYTVPAGTYTSYVDKAAANAIAVNALNTNGQAAANALPCLGTLTATNTTSTIFDVGCTCGTPLGPVYPGYSTTSIGTLPIGSSYILFFTPRDGGIGYQVLVNGVLQGGYDASFAFSGQTNITIQGNLQNTGSCSFSAAAGYTSPTSAISNSYNTVTGYIVCASNSVMSAGNTYTAGSIIGGCWPTQARSWTFSSAGYTWTGTIDQSGHFLLQLAAGSADVPAGTYITTSLSYNL